MRSSVQSVDLDDIARGDVDAAGAHSFIVQYLSPPNEDLVEDLYTALRSWLWTTLNERRRDDDLKAWFEIIRGVASYVEKDFQLQAERLKVLYELLYESISVEETIPVADLLQRSHVTEILKLLHSSGDRPVERAAICKDLNFKQANLSRVMSLLTANGLVERLAHGKAASYELTLAGRGVAERVTLTSSEKGSHKPQSQLAYVASPAEGSGWEVLPPKQAFEVKEEVHGSIIVLFKEPAEMRHTYRHSALIEKYSNPKRFAAELRAS
uniref:hypothetical protein n=1 Tax=Ensifer adhaerens TaxID=106592 RepID=UPI003F498C40